MKHFTIDAENNITLHASAKEAEAVANAERFGTSAALAKLAEKWSVARLVEIWNSLPGASPVKKFTDRATGVTRIWKAIQSLGENAAAQEFEATTEIVAEPVAQPLHAEPAPVSVEPPITSEPVAPAPEQKAEPEAAAIEAQEPSVAQPESATEPTTPFDEPVADVSAPAPDVAPVEAKASKKATRAKKTSADAPKAKATREGSKTDTILGLLKRPGGASLKEIMEATSWQAHSVRGFVSGMLTKKMGLTVVSAKSETGERTYSINA